MEEPNRKRIQAYFRNQKRVPPKWTWISVLAGIPLLFLYGAGVVPIAVGGMGLRHWLKRAKDEEIDQALASDLVLILRRAIGATGLNTADYMREPIFLTGPRIWDTGKSWIAFRPGKDGQIRHNPVAVTGLFFAPKYLDVYQCLWDMETGQITSESTHEYFYIDIVSADIQTRDRSFALSKSDRKHLDSYEDLESLIKENKLVLDDARIFTISTTGGASVQHLLDAPGLLDLTGTGAFSTKGVQEAVQEIRAIAREKRIDDSETN
jgi:hypothetical protein